MIHRADAQGGTTHPPVSGPRWSLPTPCAVGCRLVKDAALVIIAGAQTHVCRSWRPSPQRSSRARAHNRPFDVSRSAQDSQLNGLLPGPHPGLRPAGRLGPVPPFLGACVTCLACGLQ